MTIKTFASRIIRHIPILHQLFDAARKSTYHYGCYPPGHYYSPIPSAESVKNISDESGLISLVEINFNDQGQLALLHELARFYDELPFGEEKKVGVRYFLDNGWFAYSDGIFLYSMIRHFKPARIIEIGSGFSSASILDTVDQDNSINPQIDFIEPYPDRLKTLLKDSDAINCRIHQCNLQDVDQRVFDNLKRNDFLVVDSSHVVKYGSDVFMIILNILPRLSPGVIVHFHDIFRNFEYPASWIKEGRYWNENYFLRAFLAYNPSWEIVLFNDYVNKRFESEVLKLFPLCDKNHGASIYIRKLG